MLKFSKIASSSLLTAIFFIADKAFAGSTATTNIVTTRELQDWIPDIFNWVAVIAGLIFVVLFLVGGVQYLTAAGNEEQSSKAKKLLVDAVVGLLIVMVAWAAGRWVLNSLGVPTDNVIPV